MQCKQQNDVSNHKNENFNFTSPIPLGKTLKLEALDICTTVNKRRGSNKFGKTGNDDTFTPKTKSESGEMISPPVGIQCKKKGLGSDSPFSLPSTASSSSKFHSEARGFILTPPKKRIKKRAAAVNAPFLPISAKISMDIVSKNSPCSFKPRFPLLRRASKHIIRPHYFPKQQNIVIPQSRLCKSTHASGISPSLLDLAYPDLHECDTETSLDSQNRTLQLKMRPLSREQECFL